MDSLIVWKFLIRPATTLFVGSHLLDPLLEFCNGRRVVLIADEKIQDPLFAKKIGAEFLTIPSGEKTKRLETVERLVDQLCQMGCERDTLLIAMGGGVTTDLVGFVASIYMRGVPLILIPTTLLAMVDAAIGGKTGIDTAWGKNLLGTVYPPQAIFADLDRLQTLPEGEWFNGMAEILKMGLICDSQIWERGPGRDPELMVKAIQGKIAIVDQDPLEQGLRRVLNFGHTVGHALERVSEYMMPHGEAVAFGCVVEAYLSMKLGYLAEQEFAQIEAVYGRFPLRLPKNYDRGQFLSAMAQDKKKARGEVRCVILEKIGRALPFEGTYCRVVKESEWESALDWMEQWKSFR